jgi:putative copper export protein
MEHSLLHALQLSGPVVGMGGAFLMLGLFLPALRAGHHNQRPPRLARELEASVARWTFRAGLGAILAALLNFLVDVAEIDGRTIFGGLSPDLVWRFASVTTVGHLALLRLGALVLTAAATRFPRRIKWKAVFVGALAAALCESLICHAAAQPTGRAAAIGAELAHILAASLWMGVLLHLLLVRRAIVSADDGGIALLADILRRFSPVALAVAGLLALSGLVLTVRYICTPGGLSHFRLWAYAGGEIGIIAASPVRRLSQLPGHPSPASGHPDNRPG